MRQGCGCRVGEVQCRVDRVHGLGLGICADHGRGRLALGGEHRGLLGTLGLQDRGLLLALGGEDRSAALALGLQLLLHRLLHRCRRIDGLQLHAIDADPPLARGLVEHPA